MVLFWEIMGSDKKRKLIASDDDTGRSSTSFVIHPPMTPRNLPAPSLPYRVENWTFDCETQSANTWALRPGLRHVDSSDILPTLGRRILDGEASWNQHPRFKGEFCFIKGYWEWTEVILSVHRELLEAAAVYDGVYASLFTYDRSTHIIQAFCEAWCPLTNTLLTSAGELSISLWDVHVLCGLPISGDIYDEHVPSASELTGTDVSPGSVPRCCKYLFQAYHHLYSRKGSKNDESSIHVIEWIDFWSRRKHIYTRPPPRNEDKKRTRSKSTHNPTGRIPKFAGWNRTTRAPFTELGIPSECEEETHLAAYLSCWLCVFVLPVKGTMTIRYQTFKMASMMATGKKLNLGIPVLASIYNGLNVIAQSPTPGQAAGRFAFHYVYGWLSFYFATHFANDCSSVCPRMITYSGEGGARQYGTTEARRKIFKADDVKWVCTTRHLTKDVHVVDDRDTSPIDHEYLMCLRSNYLVFRWADHCVAEPYTPHRFSRQFSYYQAGSPGILGDEEHTVTLSEGFMLWRQFTFKGSNSRITFPATRVSVKKYFSKDYKAWWSKVHGDYLERHIKDLAPDHPADVQPEKDITKRRVKDAAPKRKNAATVSDSSDEERADNHNRKRQNNRASPSPARGDEKISACREADSSSKKAAENATEESEHSNAAQASSSSDPRRSPLEEPHTNQEKRPAVSIFSGQDIILEEFKATVINVWNRLRGKLEETPVEHLSSLKEEFQHAFANLGRLGIDISPLETRVDEIFQKAQKYDELRSMISERTSSEALPSAQDVRKKAHDEVTRLKKDFVDQHKILKTLQGKKDELEQELKAVCTEMDDCGTTIAEVAEDLGKAETALSEAEAEVTRIQELTVLTPEDEQSLSKAQEDLEACKDNMLNFDLFY